MTLGYLVVVPAPKELSIYWHVDSFDCNSQIIYHHLTKQCLRRGGVKGKGKQWQLQWWQFKSWQLLENLESFYQVLFFCKRQMELSSQFLFPLGCMLNNDKLFWPVSTTFFLPPSVIGETDNRRPKWALSTCLWIPRRNRLAEFWFPILFYSFFWIMSFLWAHMFQEEARFIHIVIKHSNIYLFKEIFLIVGM